ncbi:MAG: hypothetical protein JST92_15625 [Deltaproteobacteria bacterium]|nr:hypothetical protein [Deltaproteobacteria bacterium]
MALAASIRSIARRLPVCAALALAFVSCGGSNNTTTLGTLGADCLLDRDAACASSLCLVLDSGTAYCTQACAAPADCPDGYLCVAAGAQGSVCQSRGAGGVCSEDGDCPAGLKCDTASALCYVPVTRSACGSCTSDKQCGTGGTCNKESSGETFCAPACGAGDSCATGFICAASASAGGAKRCLPATSTNTVGSCRGGRPLCAPCTGDLECGKPGDLCVRNLISEESFCGTTCQTTTDCPAHFSCVDLTGTGSGPNQCVPDSGTCAGYCDSTDQATVARECGLGSTCDLANRTCVRKTDGSICAQCSSDDDCKNVTGARCVANRTAGSPFFGEQFCGSDCSTGTCPGGSCGKNPSACQAGFTCSGIGQNGAWPYQCVPSRGSCQGGLQRLGDTCAGVGGADCLSGICAQFGIEQRCSASCTQNSDCGDARWHCCSAVGSDKYNCAQEANGAAGVCAPVGGSFGDDCSPGSPPCQEGYCLDLGTAQLCTKTCDAAHACHTGFACQTADIKDQTASAGTSTPATTQVCFPDGGGDTGAACAFGPAACKSHLCLKKDSGNVCTKTCLTATECPTDWTCDTVNNADGSQSTVCLPPGAGP